MATKAKSRISANGEANVATPVVVVWELSGEQAGIVLRALAAVMSAPHDDPSIVANNNRVILPIYDSLMQACAAAAKGASSAER